MGRYTAHSLLAIPRQISQRNPRQIARQSLNHRQTGTVTRVPMAAVLQVPNALHVEFFHSLGPVSELDLAAVSGACLRRCTREKRTYIDIACLQLKKGLVCEPGLQNRGNEHPPLTTFHADREYGTGASTHAKEKQLLPQNYHPKKNLKKARFTSLGRDNTLVDKRGMDAADRLKEEKAQRTATTGKCSSQRHMLHPEFELGHLMESRFASPLAHCSRFMTCQYLNLSHT
jgi:hypothetical protein